MRGVTKFAVNRPYVYYSVRKAHQTINSLTVSIFLTPHKHKLKKFVFSSTKCNLNIKNQCFISSETFDSDPDLATDV